MSLRHFFVIVDLDSLCVAYNRMPITAINIISISARNVLFRSGPWDLEIATNAVIFERPPIVTPHPHPDIETMRAQLTNKLRQTYQELCHSREGAARRGNRGKEMCRLVLAGR